MADITRGPWSVDRETVGFGDSLRVVRWLVRDGKDGGRGFTPVATIHAGFVHTEADAAAISAVPELLAYAECSLALCSWLDGRINYAERKAVLERHGIPDDERQCKAINELGRKALAKAKGGPK